MIETNIHIIPAQAVIEASGHSGYARKGADIICSAYSILFFTLAQSLQDEGVPVETDEKDSLKHISIQVDIGFKENILINYFKTGVLMLAKKYPMHVALPKQTGGINA